MTPSYLVLLLSCVSWSTAFSLGSPKLATRVGHVSKRRQTALAEIEAYNHWDLDEIISYRSADCIHQVLPGSLGRPPMDNTQYRAYFATFIPLFFNFTVNINEITEDAQANRVSVWAASTANSPIGPYTNEYVLMFHFNRFGDKITHFYEFVDSGYSSAFFRNLTEYLEGGGS